jgi:hypothetical protein
MKKKLLSDETIDELKQAVTKTIQGFERELWLPFFMHG